MRLVYDISFQRAANVLKGWIGQAHVRLAGFGITCEARFEVAPRSEAPRASGLRVVGTAATAPTEPALRTMDIGIIRRGGSL